MPDFVPNKPSFTPDKPSFVPDGPRFQPDADPNAASGYTGPAQPFTDLPSTTYKVAQKNFNDMVEGFDGLSQPGLLNKALAGLEMVGGAVGIPFSVIEGPAKALVGDPIERGMRAEGMNVPGLGGYIGEGVSLVSSFFTPVPGFLGKAGKAASELKPLQEGKALLSPTSMSAGANSTGEALSVKAAWEAARSEQANHAVEGYIADMHKLPPDQQLKWAHAYETGAPLSSWGTWSEPLAKVLRSGNNQRVAEVQKVTKGKRLQNPIENLLGHFWKDTPQSRALASNPEFQAWFKSKRNLSGAGGFLKQRTIATIKEGIDKFGLEPVTTNPIELQLLKWREMDRWMSGEVFKQGMVKRGTAKWFKAGAPQIPGWRAVEDKLFKSWRPSSVKVTGSFDMSFRKGITDFMTKHGMPFKLDLPSLEKVFPGIGNRTLGAYDPRSKMTAVKFAMPDFVFAHEFGHALDYKYGLNTVLKADSRAWAELANLAAERVASTGTKGLNPAYVNYLLNERERVANFVHGYLYSPEITQRVAPTATRNFERFISKHPELNELKNIKPGFEPGLAEAKFLNMKEWVPNGEYRVQDSVAKILNNWSDAGLKDSTIYQSMRKLGGILNSFQLAISGFHVIFALNDIMISNLAHGLMQVAKGYFKEGGLTILKTPISPYTTIRDGRKLINDVKNGVSNQLTKAFVEGGRRVKMDEFYQSSSSGSFVKSFQNGTFFHELKTMMKDSPWSAPITLATRSLETMTAPLFEYLIPAAKNGVFHQHASAWLAEHPGAGPYEMRHAMQKIGDSIDNRLGQMVYDNIHWSRTQKDLAFIFVRSVGWNMGTVRELGGALVDTANAGRKLLAGQKAEYSLRMAYATGLAMIGAMEGATLNYLMTGESPKSLEDYYFPRTGRLLPDHSEERMNIPGYTKDAVEINAAPLHTLMNKTHPLLTIGAQWYENRDYYGAAIYNPDDPFSQEMSDWLEYMKKEFEPFSVRNIDRRRKEEDMPTSEKVLSILGFQRAPTFITDPEKTERAQRLHDRAAVRKLVRERSRRETEASE